jgi:hypothetical protein
MPREDGERLRALPRSEVDQVAKTIYECCVSGKPCPFEGAGKDCHAFYRGIARWHLRRVDEARQKQRLQDMSDWVKRSVGIGIAQALIPSIAEEKKFFGKKAKGLRHKVIGGIGGLA